MGSVLEVDDMDIRHNISNSVGILIHTKSMGEINKCIPIKANGRIYQVRISEDHNRSILLNNLDDSKKGSLEEDSIFGDEDDDSDGIPETEVVRNSEEASFDDDHREVVKNHEFDSSEFDSSSHVSPAYEEAAREASECSSNCNVHLNSNLNQDRENDIHTDVNLEAQHDGKAHSVINHKKVDDVVGGTLLMWDSSIFARDEVLIGWDTKAEEGCLTSTDRLKREEYLMDLNFLEQKERDSLKQKSQVKWEVEGDENTKFFHSHGDDVTLLESNFTMDEIKTAEWDCCSFKSPSPDGFNFKFIKRLFGIGVSPEEVSSIARSVNCSHGLLPFIYLGLSVGRSMKKIDAWNEVVNKFTRRLSSWKANMLSIGGRLTLVKSVLVVFPDESGALWRRVIIELQGVNGGFDQTTRQGRNSGTWANIVRRCFDLIKQMGVDLDKIMEGKVLYALEASKDCVVADRWVLEEDIELVEHLEKWIFFVEEESLHHCFLSCSKIKIIWRKLWSWWKSPPLYNLSLVDILKGKSGFIEKKPVEKLVHACKDCVFYGPIIVLLRNSSHGKIGSKIPVNWLSSSLP
ncbi:hypothetical protein Tco_0623780 [Tanacetum coccineum]|uniref:Uncharacterized protein n=1 Tax=Tanacetum coccineum TaxID=301880 RepID=A0ABQ4WC08_9ASTR